MTIQQAIDKAVASGYIEAITVLRVKGGRKPKILPLSPMAQKALEQAVKAFDLEAYEKDLLYIASAIAKGKPFIEGEDINRAYQLFTGDY